MSFELHHRFLVTASTVDAVRTLCEPTEDYVWIGSKGSNGKQRLRRYTLRGVPAKRIDLALIEQTESAPICVEIGTKTGKFDGDKRTQIVLRYWRAGDQQLLPYGDLRVAQEDECSIPPDAGLHPSASNVAGNWLVLCATWRSRQVVRPERPPLGRDGKILPRKPERTITVPGGSWIEAYQQLRTGLSADFDHKRIVLWHWSNYYSACVPAEDLDAIIAEFAIILEPRLATLSLAEANRIASRLLYRAGVNNGWRKLTLHERQKYYMHGGQWHRQEDVLRRRADLGYPTGAGQYTQEAAAGNVMRQAERDGYIRTAHGIVEVE